MRRVVAKILLTIFFFVFAFAGCQNVSWADTQPDFCKLNNNCATECIAINVDNESYSAIPTNNSDNGTTPEATSTETLSFNKNFHFSKNSYINNYNILSFLFKTEIYPNAP